MESPEDERTSKTPENSPLVREVDTLPIRLGLEEPAELGPIRDTLIEAIAASDKESSMRAWQQYLDIAEPQADLIQDESGRIALIIAQGVIWREGGNIAAYLGCLLDAHIYSDNVGNEIATGVLAAEISTYYGSPEFIEAIAPRDY